MNRRKFVLVSAASVCILPLGSAAAFMKNYYEPPLTKPQWLIDLVHFNDEDLKHILVYKITDTKHRYYGGYMSDTEVPNPHSTCAFINRAAAAVSVNESAFYASAAVLKNMELAALALLKMQHEDGTIDLVDTNFHSPPDTAFMVKRLAQSYNILSHSGISGKEHTLALLKQFMQQAGEALITGGIHTPNHRWVVSAALTKLNELWPDPRYVKRVDEWFAEHIDIDPDGQYTEKSTYGYSAVIDRVLITTAKGLQRPWILDAVRKNLQMMKYYLHPNGEVVTEASSRQDKGQIGTMENYYYACRYMALLDKDGEMAALCRLIEKTSFRKLTDTLNYYLEDSFLWNELPAAQPLPVSYVKSFPYSGLVRIRRKEWDATLLSENPAWLSFHKEHAVLQGMRVAASFFGKGQFQTDKINAEGNTWVLSRKLEGPYYQPFPAEKIQPGMDMAKAPRSERTQSNVQYLTTTVTIAERKEGLSVQVDMNGTEGVPVTMELIFRKGGTFAGVQAHTSKKDAWLFEGKEASYASGNSVIRFGPGKLEHKNIQLRGALPQVEGYTVYLTGFTPFSHTIQLA